MVELSDLFPISVDLPIVDPHGDPTGVTLKVTGQHTRTYQAVSHTLQQRMLKPEQPTPAELEEMNAELLVACVVGWDGFTVGGEPLPFSKEKATEILSNPELSFIREQVERFTSKSAHFFRKRSNPA